MTVSHGKKAQKRPKISTEIESEIEDAVNSFGDPELSFSITGRFCYITHGGSPVCRLGYTGENLWDFAIYRYTTGSYGNGGHLLPSKTTLVDGIDTALCAYELK